MDRKQDQAPKQGVAWRQSNVARDRADHEGELKSAALLSEAEGCFGVASPEEDGEGDPDQQ